MAEAGATDIHELYARCQKQEWLVFSIDSDLMFFPEEQEKLVAALKKAHVPVVWMTAHSDKGHDSFLIEPRLYAPHLQHVLGDGKRARR